MVRAEDLVAAEERVRTLLDAVVAVGGDLDLHATLERIVVSAASLVNARYAALGVLGGDSGVELSDFITHGFTDEQRARIGSLPRGHGILGLLITDPRPLRLHDLREHPASYGIPRRASADGLLPRCSGAGPGPSLRQPVWKRCPMSRDMRTRLQSVKPLNSSNPSRVLLLPSILASIGGSGCGSYRA